MSMTVAAVPEELLKRDREEWKRKHVKGWGAKTKKAPSKKPARAASAARGKKR